MLTDYATDLGIDLLAIFLLAYVLYFRRHRRADLLLGYVSLNIGIFVAMSLLSQVRVDIALGFGLFAILSIIRLRSNSVTQQEVAYYFIALVLGLVNGLDLDNRPLLLLVNALLVLTMFVVDSGLLRDRARRLDITLDTVHTDEAALVADLERRLGGKVKHHEVNEIDHSRGTMLVDVRYQAGSGDAPPAAAASWIEVTLDVVHNGESALVADLERRLGGRVLQHRVKEIDYVRDITVVDVRCQVGRPVHDSRLGAAAPPNAPRPAAPRAAHPSPKQVARSPRPAGPPPAAAVARSPRPAPSPNTPAPGTIRILDPRSAAETTQIFERPAPAAPVADTTRPVEPANTPGAAGTRIPEGTETTRSAEAEGAAERA